MTEGANEISRPGIAGKPLMRGQTDMPGTFILFSAEAVPFASPKGPKNLNACSSGTKSDLEV